MIRVVPTGDLGLDVLLGGGWRLVKRFEDRESATVVVRGGSGAGKTLMGIQVALELAKALGGDVAVGCVEILPTEYVAQLQSARPALPRKHVAILPATAAASPEDGPRVYVSLLQDLSTENPDLVTSLEALDASVKAAGGKPVAFIVDSLIDGYGLGASTPRIDADDILKFAARYGNALVLCEEVTSDTDSPWVFAADTVLELGVESRERGRWIEVRKHRFGPSATGRHELDLVGRRQRPEAYPDVVAWRAQGPVVLQGGAQPPSRDEPPLLGWENGLEPRDIANTVAPGNAELRGHVVLVAASDDAVCSGVAFALRPAAGSWTTRTVIELNPSATQPEFSSGGGMAIVHLPTYRGVARALRWLIEPLEESDGRRCLIVSDLAVVLSGPHGDAWADAVATVTMLVSDARPNWTVVFCDSAGMPSSSSRTRVQRDADVLVAVNRAQGKLQGTFEARQMAVTFGGSWPGPGLFHAQATRQAARRGDRMR